MGYNKKIKITEDKILSDHWYTLRKISYQFKNDDDQWESHVREAYDRGNGAAVLLYDASRAKVILTKQFRMPTYVNGNRDGMMIEACAGMLDEDNPDDCIKREILEETGYQIQEVSKVFESYMSPGAVTEVLHLYVAPYSPDQRISEGGGLASEQEHIEVLEIDFSEAIEMMSSGKIKDAKTIMLLQFAQINNLLN